MGIQLNKKDLRFIGILVLVHAVFFLMALVYKRIYMGDSFEYVYEALNIKDHFFFYSANTALPIQPEYMTQRQPGYPLFLLAVYMFTVNNWVVIVLQNILSIINMCYCRVILTRLGYEKKYDWLLLLLLMAYPAQFIHANTIAPDILLQTFTLLYLGYFILLYQTGEKQNALKMSFALVDGMMIKPVLYPFAFIHLIILLALFSKKYQRTIMVAAILPVCVVLGYNSINYLRTGKFHFTSNQSFNAIYYYNGFFGQKNGVDTAEHFLEKERAKVASFTTYKDRYDYANKRGMELLRQNFFPYMAYHLMHSARIFIEPGKAEIDLFTGKLTYGRLYSNAQNGFFATLKNKGWSGMGEYARNNPSLGIVLLVLLFNIIRLIGLFIFFFKSNVPLHIRLFILILFGYFAIAAGPIANTRYFLPLSLIAIGCSVIGYAGVLEKRNIRLTDE